MATRENGYYWLRRESNGKTMPALFEDGFWKLIGDDLSHTDEQLPQWYGPIDILSPVTGIGVSGPAKRLNADTINFDRLHEYVGFADDLELDFGFNEKELLTKRRKIWSLNRENAAWKYRTMREGFILKIFKFAL